MSIAQKFKNQVSTWTALVGMDSNNDPAALEVTNGAAHVNLRDSNGNELLDLGGTAVMAQEFDSLTIGAAAGSMTTFDVSLFDEMHFDISWDTGTDAVTIFTSKDGVNFSSVARKPWDNNTGALAASASLTANGDWRMDLNCKKVRFTKAGTTSTVTINWSAKVANRSKF